MAEKFTQTQEELERHLQEQLRLMTASIVSFDNGLEEEGKRLAASIRLLVHDTSNSTSLLKQLGLKNIQFDDTSDDIKLSDSEIYPSFMGLIFLNINEGRYTPLLDSPITKKRKVTFDEWWNRIIFMGEDGTVITRRNLVLWVSNQDGGTHVDPALDEPYAKLSRQNSLAWWVGRDKLERPKGKPELVAMRQIAHELLRSLEPVTNIKPPLPEPYDGMFISNIRIGFAPLDARKTADEMIKKKIGRNDPCPCGSRKKHKKCHGKQTKSELNMAAPILTMEVMIADIPKGRAQAECQAGMPGGLSGRRDVLRRMKMIPRSLSDFPDVNKYAIVAQFFNRT